MSVCPADLLSGSFSIRVEFFSAKREEQHEREECHVRKKEGLFEWNAERNFEVKVCDCLDLSGPMPTRRRLALW